MKRYILIASLALMCVACQNKTASIKGHFVGKNSQTVFLEQLSPSFNTVIDSAVIDDKGRFAFKVTLPSGESTLYNLRVGEESITVLLGCGQRLRVDGVMNIARNYTISGSEESALIKEVRDLLQNGAATLDSISTAYVAAENLPEDQRKAIATQYMQEYYRIKREHIQFIVRNSKTLAGIYALYQRLPNDEILFNGQNDIIYYRMVADSVEQVYPTSPYLKSLRNAVDNYENSDALARMIDQKMGEAKALPEITMSDMYGKKHSLSELEGKVVLLDFWSASVAESNLTNAEMKELYARYADEGFEIYQISVDESKSVWVNAVQSQRLPWISVCDLRGAASYAVRTFNVTSIPANFLINREGEIVAKNIYGDKLRQQVDKLMQ